MPLKLLIAQANLMYMMMIIFWKMLYTTCFAYFNDIIGFDRNYIEMLGRFENALGR